ncbi:MAG: hypothetical protein AAGC76_09515 [Luteibacter sp.]|uniref:hypothetical protein n=1 Tax=Luteibacter sp. TaxID=1886636 RepID=UPI0028080AE9|nr:hypothetical protein [Luteibacter sp.]MDQ7996078.1 hypothetical protein [Luteibacter sp.]
MSTVRQLRPLSNIPHMLREWADMFERGDEPMPKAVILVTVQPDDTYPPQVFGAGDDNNRIETMGALAFAANFVGSWEEGE